MQRLAESTLRRLRNWDISDVDLQALRQEGRGQSLSHLRFRSQWSGTREACPPGTALLAWRDAVPDRRPLERLDARGCFRAGSCPGERKGQSAHHPHRRIPRPMFNGKVTYIYPTVNPATRTAKVRIELPNGQGCSSRLCTEGWRSLRSAGRRKSLAVPDSAVL